jgi:endonuclease YncB( thermonuclease family)
LPTTIASVSACKIATFSLFWLNRRAIPRGDESAVLAQTGAHRDDHDGSPLAFEFVNVVEPKIRQPSVKTPDLHVVCGHD